MDYRRRHIKPKIRILKNKKRLIQRPWFWIFLLILIIIISIFYVVFFLPKFQVTAINVSGNQKIQNKDIEDLAWADINKKIVNVGGITISTKSIFIINTKNLIGDILNKFPNIEDVKVEKKWPQHITLKINERQPFAVFCSDYIENPRLQNNRDQNKDKCFFMDKNGIIFEELKNIPQDIFIIRGEANNKEVSLGMNVTPKNIIDIVSNIQKNLKDNFQIDIKEVLVSNPLIFKTSENWKIYFDPNSDINLQITKMNILLKDEIPVNTRKSIQYIYLQYKDRAYYR